MSVKVSLPLALTVCFLLLAIWAPTTRRVQAFPEFAVQTGETCGTCHFNSAGGGPRTPRGELWVLDNRPDAVPELPDIGTEEESIEEILPESADVEQSELTQGAQIYELFTCDNCHGTLGEGSSDAPPLNQEIISAEVIRTAIRTGPQEMPAIPEAILSEEEMTILIAYVQNLATGRVVRTEVLNASGPISGEDTP